MRDRLIELLGMRQDNGEKWHYSDCGQGCEVVTNERIADYLLAKGIVVLPRGSKDALFDAVDALADMVNQFGYSTTFRRKDAVCDGGLSALESAFWSLEQCGCKVNSNGTINREALWNFSMEESTKKALEAERALKGGVQE